MKNLSPSIDVLRAKKQEGWGCLTVSKTEKLFTSVMESKIHKQTKKTNPRTKPHTSTIPAWLNKIFVADSLMVALLR